MSIAKSKRTSGELSVGARRGGSRSVCHDGHKRYEHTIRVDRKKVLYAFLLSPERDRKAKARHEFNGSRKYVFRGGMSPRMFFSCFLAEQFVLSLRILTDTQTISLSLLYLINKHTSVCI